MLRIYISLIVGLLITNTVYAKEKYSKDYKRAYATLKKNDCETAISLLRKELNNNKTLSSKTKSTIKTQIKECKNLISLKKVIKEKSSTSRGIEIEN